MASTGHSGVIQVEPFRSVCPRAGCGSTDSGRGASGAAQLWGHLSTGALQPQPGESVTPSRGHRTGPLGRNSSGSSEPSVQTPTHTEGQAGGANGRSGATQSAHPPRLRRHRGPPGPAPIPPRGSHGGSGLRWHRPLCDCGPRGHPACRPCRRACVLRPDSPVEGAGRGLRWRLAPLAPPIPAGKSAGRQRRAGFVLVLPFGACVLRWLRAGRRGRAGGCGKRGRPCGPPAGRRRGAGRPRCRCFC